MPRTEAKLQIYLQQMTESSRGEVTAKISILHSLMQYAIAMRTQFPNTTSKLVMIPHKVLRSVLTHSTSGECCQKATYNHLFFLVI